MLKDSSPVVAILKLNIDSLLLLKSCSCRPAASVPAAHIQVSSSSPTERYVHRLSLNPYCVSHVVFAGKKTNIITTLKYLIRQLFLPN